MVNCRKSGDAAIHQAQRSADASGSIILSYWIMLSFFPELSLRAAMLHIQRYRGGLPQGASRSGKRDGVPILCT